MENGYILILIVIAIVVVFGYLFFRSIKRLDSDINELKSGHEITNINQQSLQIKNDRLFVNGQEIFIPEEIKGKNLSVTQVNGKLVVNGYKYNFRSKIFYK